MHLSYDEKKGHSSISIDANLFSTSFFLFVFPCGLNRELMRAAPHSCKIGCGIWRFFYFIFLWLNDISVCWTNATANFSSSVDFGRSGVFSLLQCHHSICSPQTVSSPSWNPRTVMLLSGQSPTGGCNTRAWTRSRLTQGGCTNSNAPRQQRRPVEQRKLFFF